MMPEHELKAAILARLGLLQQADVQAPVWQKRVLTIQKLAEQWNEKDGEETAQKIDTFLRSDTHEAVRMAAVRALGQLYLLAPEEVRWEPFLRALGDKHPEVQATMVQVLKFFVESWGTSHLSQQIIEMLWQKKLTPTGTNTLLRLSIIQLLGMLGTQISVPAIARLVELTRDADWQIREAAVLARS